MGEGTWLFWFGFFYHFQSIELLPDGRLVIQALPGIDPQLVSRVRQMIAQHEDVLRRLS